MQDKTENTSSEATEATNTEETQEKILITKDMTVEEAMKINPMVAPILMGAGMYCVTCYAAQGETIEEAAMVHGFDVEDLLDAINNYDQM